MKYVELGKTGLMVSQFVFGTLTMGPLQRDLTVQEGGRLIQEGLKRGINMVDTAITYGTYPHIREALNNFQGKVIIATKTHSVDYTNMESDVYHALEAFNRNHIEVFLLHAVKNEEDLNNRQGAWDCLVYMKKKGILNAIGVSSHNIDIVEKVIDWPEVDVIHPIFNKLSFGLINKKGKHLEEVMRKAYMAGKGIYAMKPLAGGHLYTDLVSSFAYVFDFPYMHCAAVGMVTLAELEVNLKIYYKGEVEAEELRATARGKKVYISPYCEGCGSCLEACDQDSIFMQEGKAYIKEDVCIMCGYCKKHCPHGMVRII